LIKKTAFTILGLTLAVGIAVSQEKGLLQPSMEPTGGWTPAGDLGSKPTAPWTDTTIAAGVDKKPLTGKTITVTGEIIDLSCYLQLGKHGDKHASCGKKCIDNGEPIGMVTKDGEVYLAMAEEHDPRRDGGVGFRKAASQNFAKVMTVTGTGTMVGGVKTVYVQGFVGK
jgi:hypothetical protein